MMTGENCMEGSKSRADAAQERLFRHKKCLTLLICVVIICLSFGVYTLIVNALAHGVASQALASPPFPIVLDVVSTVMKVDPAIKVVAPGGTFSVTVAIENAVDLGAFEFELTYNPSVVQLNSVAQGPFLGSTGRNVSEVGPTFGSGSVTYGAFTFGAEPGPNGDGVLAILTLQATSVGTSTLHLQNIVATDTSAVSLSPSAEDGEVIVGDVVPIVNSISPSSGEAGTMVEDAIVRGENFQLGASVQLTRTGQTPILASLTDVQDLTQISCTLDLGKAATGQWNVVVTNPDGQSGTLSNGFTVELPSPPPTITSIAPGSGDNNKVVHINNLAGSDFQSGATVKLSKTGQADIEADNVVVMSDSRITCDFDLRGTFPGKWTVRVTNSDAQYAELADGFTVMGLVYLPGVLKNY